MLYSESGMVPLMELLARVMKRTRKGAIQLIGIEPNAVERAEVAERSGDSSAQLATLQIEAADGT